MKTYLCEKGMLLVGALLGREVQCDSMIIAAVLSSKMAHMTYDCKIQHLIIWHVIIHHRWM